MWLLFSLLGFTTFFSIFFLVPGWTRGVRLGGGWCGFERESEGW